MHVHYCVYHCLQRNNSCAYSYVAMYVYIYVRKSTEYVQLNTTFLICAYANVANRLIKVQRLYIA